jgi:hypothetical protein
MRAKLLKAALAVGIGMAPAALVASESIGGFRSGQWSATTVIERAWVPAQPEVTVPPIPPSTQEGCQFFGPDAPPPPRFLAGTGPDSICLYESWTIADGRIDARIACSAGPVEMRSDVTGTYDRDGFDVRQEVTMLQSGIEARLTAATRGTRSGECTATP